jgi:two-component system chemotaxis sensor kinase CheA
MEFEEDIKDFLIECHENLENLDREIVLLEQDPTDASIISSVFRAIHTIKGTSGFFGFHLLGAVTHGTESLLSQVRDGHRVLTPQLISLILEAIDATKAIVSAIESTGKEGEDRAAGLRQRLDQALMIASPASPTRACNTVAKDSTAPASSTPSPSSAAPVSENTPQVAADWNESAEAESGAANRDASSQWSDSTIRVDVALLNRLMNMVGELVLARNELLQVAATQAAPVQKVAQRLNLITTELQEGVMKTRMQPIHILWNRLPRVVRDLASHCGKRIRLELQGANTELDKAIIEAIKDPLTHLVRNCCDHGIEAPEARIAAGKKPEGVILLKAQHEGGAVHLEISDDGAGIDLSRVKAKAVERGLLEPERASGLSQREALQLLFLPGFSTAPRITSISGRGVGLDVVKNNIERIGGTVDVVMRPEGGTTFSIKIPLTLAIIPGLIVTVNKDTPARVTTTAPPPVAAATPERRANPAADCRADSPDDRRTGRNSETVERRSFSPAGRRWRPEERFIIPQANLLELVSVSATEHDRRIRNVAGTRVFHHRGKLLPLVYLFSALGLPEARRRKGDETNIVVLQTERRQFGLVVDRICDTQEIVVKPLGRQLKTLLCYLGATIMGDGKPALILDIAGLARLSGLGLQSETVQEEAATQTVETPMEKLLLFRTRRFPRVAVPLALVHRLEDCDSAHIERAAGQLVLRYRASILPLVSLEDMGNAVTPLPQGSAKMQIIVFSDGPRQVGLLVEQILDIVDHESADLQRNQQEPRSTSHAGLLGSAIVAGHVTELLDLKTFLEASRTRNALQSPDLLNIEQWKQKIDDPELNAVLDRLAARRPLAMDSVA